MHIYVLIQQIFAKSAIISTFPCQTSVKIVTHLGEDMGRGGECRNSHICAPGYLEPWYSLPFHIVTLIENNTLLTAHWTRLPVTDDGLSSGSGLLPQRVSQCRGSHADMYSLGVLALETFMKVQGMMYRGPKQENFNISHFLLRLT